MTILMGIVVIMTFFNTYSLLYLSDRINTIAGDTNDQLGANESSLFSIDDDTIMGSEDATVTMIEFSDFECYYCGKFYTETLSQLKTNYIDTGKVKFVYRDYPLAMHQNAQKAAEAAECAGEQGKFWEYHNKLLENQNALDNESLKQYAKDLGLDETQFNTCLDSGEMTSEVQKDFSDGSSYGVTGTPTFFINDQKLVGAKPYSSFESAIEEELNK
ncbi:MAG: thioredoxin domain-containing protein [Candidatus Thermoplasmatota archaeon]|nr:thioredoxin domain-containing protein [Candidatus Thermoplasmatota archaeon]